MAVELQLQPVMENDAVLEFNKAKTTRDCEDKDFDRILLQYHIKWV